jgi:hypothetical protein
MKRAGSSLDEGDIVKSDMTTPTIQQMCPDADGHVFSSEL